MSCAKSFRLPFLAFVTFGLGLGLSDCQSDRAQWREYCTSNNHDSDRHYRSALHYEHTCTCTCQCLLHCPHTHKFVHISQVLPTTTTLLLLSKCLECTCNVVQQLLSSKYTLFMVTIVLTFVYVLLFNNCPYSRHNVLLFVIEHLYHYYWASMPHLQTEFSIVSTGHTYVYVYTCTHTHHACTYIYSHVIIYIPHHPLSAMLTFCWFLFPSYRMSLNGIWWRAA